MLWWVQLLPPIQVAWPPRLVLVMLPQALLQLDQVPFPSQAMGWWRLEEMVEAGEVALVQVQLAG